MVFFSSSSAAGGLYAGMIRTVDLRPHLETEHRLGHLEFGCAGMIRTVDSRSRWRRRVGVIGSSLPCFSLAMSTSFSDGLSLLSLLSLFLLVPLGKENGGKRQVLGAMENSAYMHEDGPKEVQHTLPTNNQSPSQTPGGQAPSFSTAAPHVHTDPYDGSIRTMGDTTALMAELLCQNQQQQAQNQQFMNVIDVVIADDCHDGQAEYSDKKTITEKRFEFS
ncbi:hypothetical protein AAC387_Pa05g0553 [Persea americana]